MQAIEWLRKCGNDGRLVSSGDLTHIQITEFRAMGRFFVDEETGLGWALVPWHLTTEKDRERDKRYFDRAESGSPGSKSHLSHWIDHASRAKTRATASDVRQRRLDQIRRHADHLQYVAERYARLRWMAEQSETTEAFLALAEAAGALTTASLEQTAAMLEILRRAGS